MSERSRIGGDPEQDLGYSESSKPIQIVRFPLVDNFLSEFNCMKKKS